MAENTIPAWLEQETFAVQHSPSCPSPYLVRLIGKGCGALDMKPYIAIKTFERELTKDAIGFGQTIEQAAESARHRREQHVRQES